MKREHSFFTLIGLLICGIPAHAQLPILLDKPWLGHFIGIQDRKFQFGILKDGDAELNPINSRGEKISKTNLIAIEFQILETSSNGKSVSKQIKPASLTSSSPAQENPTDPITIEGKVTGDASFQITITPGKKSVSLTGSLTDKGSLKDPLFLISTKFTPYPNQTSNDEKALEDFEKKIKREELSIEPSSGEKEKVDFSEKLNLAEKFPEGIRRIELKTEAYGGTEFEFSASGNSKIVFENRGKDYVWNIFTLHWIPDPKADPSTQSFTIYGD